jgi:signal transduction histidine kinase/CheY-like chemotaxis protein
MLGIDPEEAVGREIDWIFQPPLNPSRQQGEAGRVEGGQLCRRDGVALAAEYSSLPVIEDGKSQGIVMTFISTLERKRLDEQFRQAQKMEALGRLAGGIAHDFNNLLTAILGYSELIRAGISNSDPHYHEIIEINKAAQRAAGLTSQLLNFSRPKATARQCLDLNILLADMQGMVHRLLGEDVELSLTLDPSLGNILADQGQIEQVVLNLAVNARDAMPRGGKLTIMTANVEPNEGDERRGEHLPELPGAPRSTESIPFPERGGTKRNEFRSTNRGGRYVMLAAKDTGCGMDEQTQSRIFEPFFTTKAPGQGTGLGLTTVRGIVLENQGFMDVASRLGEGTVFRIYFPCFCEEPQATKTVTPQPATRKGSETILLVEDEDILRDLIQSILSRYGYHVLKAASAPEALRLGQSHPEPIHLLLTDLIMPHMSGRQLAEQLTCLRPGMKALFMSGSTDDTAARHGLSQKDIALIRKPFMPTALAQRVRGILDDGINGSTGKEEDEKQRAADSSFFPYPSSDAPQRFILARKNGQ